MTYPRYPKYRESGVEWLGDVPEGWGVVRTRWLFSIKKNISGELGYDILSVTQQGIRIKDIEGNNGQFSMDYAKYQIVDVGDFVMNHMDLLTGYVDISKFLGVTSPDYRVFTIRKPTDCHYKYFLYVFQMGYKNKIFYAFGQGSSHLGRWRLPAEQFNNLSLPFPPLSEQKTIATFLDAETARMDTLITEYETLIDLLKEKRQALINQAVTKGINPGVPMKDSGVEWLGDVPEHWSVRRLRFIANLNPSKSECSNIGEDEEVSFLPMEAIGDDGSLNLEHVKPINEVNSGYTYFRNGDVTIAKITPCFENGKGAVMSGLKGHIGFGTTELIVVRPEQNISISEYIHLIFVSAYFRKLGESWMYGAGGQKRVPDEFVRNFKIGVPPVDEQRTIVALLDTETSRMDILVQEAENGINLLRERRMTLISDAVTGKIDVRDWKGVA